MTRRPALVAVLLAASLVTAAPAHASTAVLWDDGHLTGSQDADAPRPALSLSKLYLGYWVLHHGTPEEKVQVEHMIRVSDDAVASALDRKYPHAIGQVARDFGLGATQRRGYWGNTATSANDVVRFVQAIQHDPVAQPIIRGMRSSAPVAADGFPQNFGTSRLPGAEGSKFGWSDDRVSATASVSFGPGWTAAALTLGGAQANTDEALRDIRLDHRLHPAAVAPRGRTLPFGPWLMPAMTVRELLAPYLPAEVLRHIPAEWLIPIGPPDIRLSSN